MIAEDSETLYLDKIKMKCPSQRARLEALSLDDDFDPCVLNAVEHILQTDNSIPLSILMTFLNMLRMAESSDRMLSMVAIQSGKYGAVNVDFSTQLLSYGITPLNCYTLLASIYTLRQSIYMVFVISRLWVVCPERKEDLDVALLHFYPDRAELMRLMKSLVNKSADPKVKKAMKVLLKDINSDH